MNTFTAENFSPKFFIEHIMKTNKLGESNPLLKKKIEKEILGTLNDRILVTILGAMTDEDKAAYQAIRKAHPEITEFGAMLALIEEIPALNEHMLKGINDLAEELTKDAEGLRDALDQK
jgi:hypothetical protein